MTSFKHLILQTTWTVLVKLANKAVDSRFYKDYLILKKKTMGVSVIIIALLKYVQWFKLVSWVSDVAHGPFVETVTFIHFDFIWARYSLGCTLGMYLRLVEYIFLFLYAFSIHMLRTKTTKTIYKIRHWFDSTGVNLNQF